MGKKERALKIAWDDARPVLQAEIAARLSRSSFLKEQWVPQKNVVPDGFTANHVKTLWQGGRASLAAKGCVVYPIEGAGGKQYACVQRRGDRRSRWVMALERDARAEDQDGTLCAHAMKIPHAEPT